MILSKLTLIPLTVSLKNFLISDDEILADPAEPFINKIRADSSSCSVAGPLAVLDTERSAFDGGNQEIGDGSFNHFCRKRERL